MEGTSQGSWEWLSKKKKKKRGVGFLCSSLGAPGAAYGPLADLFYLAYAYEKNT